MGILKFMIDVVCAPYSIPIGLINNKKPLDAKIPTRVGLFVVERVNIIKYSYKSQASDIS